MKKVCILTTVHHVFDSRIYYKQALTLMEAGYDVSLVAQHDSDETVRGIKIKALGYSKKRLQRMLWFPIKAMIMAIKQKADIYHFHDPELLPIGILLKLITGKKIVYDVHEDYYLDIKGKLWIPSPLRNLIANMLFFFERFALLFIDSVVVVTDMIETRYEGRKTVQIRNYPIVDLNKQLHKETANRDVTKLVYVGGISRDRGIVELVKALELIDARYSVELELLGRYVPSALEEELKRMKGYSKVKYIGWLDHKDVWEYLLASDIGMLCLHPTDTFFVSLPIKMFEYMLAGLPIIASNFPLWEEILGDAGCGVAVNPMDSKEIAEKVEYLIENKHERDIMSQKGRISAMNKYSWKSQADILLALYDSLLNKS